MAIVRAMFVGHGPSGLPEDRVVNTWHFETATDYATSVDAIEAGLRRFYSADGGAISGVSSPVGTWLSPWVQRDVELRFYDLSTPIPRVPAVRGFTLLAATSSSGYAEEVAVCLSLRAVFPPFSARRRGRLYFGPLSSSAVDPASATVPARPSPTFLTDLRVSATWLADQSSLGWAIRSSRPTQNFVQIGGGWTDNALDTQRRRGPEPSSRTQWISAVGIPV